MKILVVEDDQLLSSTLCYNLQVTGYEPHAVYSIKEALEKLRNNKYSLTILDVNLPDGSGFDLCQTLKNIDNSMAVLFLTAKDMESDVLKGYEQGADDYVTKPFSVSIFQKKIEAILNRTHAKSQDNYDDGSLFLNFAGMKGSFCGQDIDLTPGEYRILYVLTQNPNSVLTRKQLMEKLWDVHEKYVDEHALTAAISRLRHKIEKKDYIGIKTVYGMGYMWIGNKEL